jgi:hypothetical protein
MTLLTSKPTAVKRNRSESRQHVPRLPWQTGEFSRDLKLQLLLPYEFLLLCRILDKPPRVIISDFVEQLGQGTWNNESHELARQKLSEYLVEMNYSPHLSQQQMNKLLAELGIFTQINLTDASVPFLKAHEQWREHYLHHWFNRWYAATEQTHAHSPS